MIKEKTLKKSLTISGNTLHKGNKSTIILNPAPVNRGIYFNKDNIIIPVLSKFIVDTTMATTIGKGNIKIHTIEHLMSAIYSLGITNLEIKIDSNEPPILDGSSIIFLNMLEEIGVINQDRLRDNLIIERDVIVKDGKNFASISPSTDNSFYIDSTIDFSHKMIGIQKLDFKLTLDNYRKEIAPARTFGFLEEFDYLKSKDLALGASYENVIVLGNSDIKNRDGLRFKDEFVRHKILDVIGDLSVIGMQIVGIYKSFASSHSLNHQLVSKILSDKRNYSVKN